MNETLYCYKTINNATRCISNSTKTGLYVLAISNAVLAVPTVAANALVIVAILTTSSLQAPSYLLMTSLAFSDLAVGLLCQPVLCALIVVVLTKRKVYVYLLVIFTVAAILSSCVSVFTLTAISVDRYLAIRLMLRYKSIVTVQRTRRLLAMIWTFPVFLVCCIFLVRNFSNIIGALAVGVIVVCLLVIQFCYTMSFRALKLHCAQIQPNSATQSSTIDVLKYRKLLKTMVLVMVLVFLCYLPLIGINSLMVRGLSYGPLHWFMFSITSINSTLNPLIYITRMREIRQASSGVLKKLLCTQVSP